MPYSLEDEKVSQSPDAPHGRVEDDELLLRLVYHPEHVVDGKVIKAAISAQDLERRGFSVDRASYVEFSVVDARAQQQMQNVPSKRQEASVSQFGCGEVRALLDTDGQRGFIVIDTDGDENPAHAAIYGLKKGRAAIKRLKTLLLPLLQNRILLADIEK